MLKLANTKYSKMHHVIVPDHKPPKGYACKICTKKCLTGQQVIMDPTGLVDKPCCVMHVDCVKILLQTIPEVIEGSDKALVKRQKQAEEEARVSSEFEKLREKYAAENV